MKKLCFLIMLCLLSSMVFSAGIKYADDSCRTSLNNGTVSEADTNKSDSSKLSVRGDNKAAKSWIKFDISGLDVGSMTSCQLRVTLNAAKDSTCLLSAVNDDYLTNIGWTKANLTWNNGPGNYTSSDGVNPDLAVTLDDLQDNLNPAQTTLIGTVDYSEGAGGAAGDQFFMDVLSILQADTDGIVQFVLHGSGGSTDFATDNNPGGAEYWPALVYETLPTGSCSNVGTLISTYADQSCRTELFDGTNPRVDDNREDNNKLSVRGDNKAAKSWIKFDINDLGIDPNNLRAATLRITLLEPKTNTCSLSYVNDNYTSNIGWTDADLTWNNAPGNITSSDGVNPNDTVNFTVDDLQDNLDPTKTTFLSTVDYSYGGQVGDQFFFDVLDVLQQDTDGIIQFALHGAGGSTNFATHDTGNGEAYWPMLELLIPPAGADNPYPCPGDVLSTAPAGLSWTNPEPNMPGDPITCTVYFGLDPNRPQMDSLTLAPDSQGILLNTTNFPTYGNVTGDPATTYYWVVDCDDPTAGLIPGLMWDFTVDENNPPVVDAGVNQATWLGFSGTPGQEVIYLDGTTSDADLDPLTILWTQVDNGAPTVVISPDTVEDTSVTITARGDYEFMLTADDGQSDPVSDTVRIVVGDDACDASHINSGADYDPGDANQDCIINLEDFALLIAENWLDCTNALTGCN